MRYKLFINRLLLTLLIGTTINYVKAKPANSISQPYFGIKLGVSSNKTSTPYAMPPNSFSWQKSSLLSGSIIWVTGGLTGEYPISHHYAAALEIVYERKGYQNFPQKLYEESITLPILFKYYPKSIKKGISLHIGLQPSFILVRKYFTLGTDNLKQKQIKEEDLSVENVESFKMRTFDLALVGGIEYTFKNGLKLGTSMTMGILNRCTNKNSDKVNSYTYAIGNRVYIGYSVVKWF
jgi:hypothetical protein